MAQRDLHNLKRSESNTVLNGFDNVRFVHAAIGAPLGMTDFIVSGNTNSHLPTNYIGANREVYLSREKIDKTVTVRCMSLDEAYFDAAIPQPDLIKIDIEGAEKDALKHLHNLVLEKRPIIVLELHNPECDSAAWDFSVAYDYSLYSLDRNVLLNNREDVRGTLLCQPRTTTNISNSEKNGLQM